jgi:hypothetical protein
MNTHTLKLSYRAMQECNSRQVISITNQESNIASYFLRLDRIPDFNN